MPVDLKPEFVVPPSAEVLAEEAAAAGVEITATEFFPVVVILGMLVAMTAWLRPMLKGQTHQHHSLLYRAVTWPARKLIQGIGVVEARVGHAMSHWLAPKVGTVAHAFNSVTHEVHTATQALGDLADHTHEALTWLRHQVIPELISDAIRPIRARVAAAEDAIDTINMRIHTGAVEISDQLAGIGKTVGQTFTAAIGQLAVTVVELWNFVHKTVVPQLKELQEVTIPALETAVQTLTTTVTETIPQELTAIRDRLKGIEEYIAGAAFLALIVAGVEKSLSYLTCRNTKKATTELCAADPSLVDDALILIAGAAVLLTLDEYVKLMQGVVSATTTATKDLLQV